MVRVEMHEKVELAAKKSGCGPVLGVLLEEAKECAYIFNVEDEGEGMRVGGRRAEALRKRVRGSCSVGSTGTCGRGWKFKVRCRWTFLFGGVIWRRGSLKMMGMMPQVL